MRDDLDARFDELWEFSLSAYNVQGATTACLTLQDKYGLDVNVLLLCLFAGSHGCALSAEDFVRIEARVAPWRKNIIYALRDVRRSLKTEKLSSDRVIGDLYKDVLASELKAEQHEQHLIASTVVISKGSTDVGVASRNLVRYLCTLGVPVKEESLSPLAKLLGAVMVIHVCDAADLLRRSDIAIRESANS